LVEELLALVLAATTMLRTHESTMRRHGAFADAARCRRLRKAIEELRATLATPPAPPEP
jgi:hypothetical protein